MNGSHEVPGGADSAGETGSQGGQLLEASAGETGSQGGSDWVASAEKGDVGEDGL